MTKDKTTPLIRAMQGIIECYHAPGELIAIAVEIMSADDRWSSFAHFKKHDKSSSWTEDQFLSSLQEYDMIEKIAVAAKKDFDEGVSHQEVLRKLQIVKDGLGEMTCGYSDN